MSTRNAATPYAIDEHCLPTELWAFSAVQLSEAFRLDQISPVEASRVILDRLSALDPVLNAFCFVDTDSVMRQARRSEERWRSGRSLSAIDGVPVSVKDNLRAEGTPTLFGSLAVDRATSFHSDSPAVARLREAGAIILGKTTMPDFAYKVTTESPLTGVTVNPWNFERSPGGSSGGAAAAVAAGFGPLALGTDGGGSIRVPASWSGIYGFKPSFGRVPHYPRGAFAPLSHVGPMTRTVMDAALMMQEISRPDSRDWYSLPPETIDFRSDVLSGVAGMTIAVSFSLGLRDLAVEPEITKAISEAAELLRGLGATIVETDPPAVATCQAIHRTMWASYCALVVRKFGEKRASFDPGLLELADFGESIPKHAFLEATAARADVGREINAFFSRYDLLLCPVSPIFAPETPPNSSPIVPGLTSWCNQTGLPAASMPTGLSAQGLPIGVQIVGRRFADVDVLRASYAVEHLRGPLAWPPLPTA
jgi:aspartyl-tRNA(Asn)/glutamyl-tRNA(Gln) amidotransferase subunit A